MTDWSDIPRLLLPVMERQGVQGAAVSVRWIFFICRAPPLQSSHSFLRVQSYNHDWITDKDGHA